MADDLRIAEDFPTNAKTRLMIRRLGERSFRSLVTLWCHCSCNRWTGDLSGMRDDEIANAADWPEDRDPSEFVRVLAEVRFLDGEPGCYSLHDWANRQPHIFNRQARIQHSRELAEKRWGVRTAGEPDAAGNAARIAVRNPVGNAPPRPPVPPALPTPPIDQEPPVSPPSKGDETHAKTSDLVAELAADWNELVAGPWGKRSVARPESYRKVAERTYKTNPDREYWRRVMRAIAASTKLRDGFDSWPGADFGWLWASDRSRVPNHANVLAGRFDGTARNFPEARRTRPVLTRNEQPTCTSTDHSAEPCCVCGEALGAPDRDLERETGDGYPRHQSTFERMHADCYRQTYGGAA